MKDKLIKQIAEFFINSRFDYYALGAGREADSFFLENANLITAIEKNGIRCDTNEVPYLELAEVDLQYIVDHVIGNIQSVEQHN
jgi:hypothetical protein